jgi:hypothetical protein
LLPHVEQLQQIVTRKNSYTDVDCVWLPLLLLLLLQLEAL